MVNSMVERWQDFEGYWKKAQQPLEEFLHMFEMKYVLVKMSGIQLSQDVLELMMMRRAGLTEQEQRDLVLKLNEGKTFLPRMKMELRDIFKQQYIESQAQTICTKIERDPLGEYPDPASAQGLIEDQTSSQKTNELGRNVVVLRNPRTKDSPRKNCIKRKLCSTPSLAHGSGSSQSKSIYILPKTSRESASPAPVITVMSPAGVNHQSQASPANSTLTTNTPLLNNAIAPTVPTVKTLLISSPTITQSISLPRLSTANTSTGLPASISLSSSAPPSSSTIFLTPQQLSAAPFRSATSMYSTATLTTSAQNTNPTPSTVPQTNINSIPYALPKSTLTHIAPQSLASLLPTPGSMAPVARQLGIKPGPVLSGPTSLYAYGRVLVRKSKKMKVCSNCGLARANATGHRSVGRGIKTCPYPKTFQSNEINTKDDTSLKLNDEDLNPISHSSPPGVPADSGAGYSSSPPVSPPAASPPPVGAYSPCS